MYETAKRSLAFTVVTGGLLLTGTAYAQADAAVGLGAHAPRPSAYVRYDDAQARTDAVQNDRDAALAAAQQEPGAMSAPDAQAPAEASDSDSDAQQEPQADAPDAQAPDSDAQQAPDPDAQGPDGVEGPDAWGSGSDCGCYPPPPPPPTHCGCYPPPPPPCKCPPPPPPPCKCPPPPHHHHPKPPPVLADTGSSDTLPVLGAGLALLGGAGLVFASRRRQSR